MKIKLAAEREVKRMEKVFSDIKINQHAQAKSFYDFANNYFKDSKHFLDKSMYIEAFEAAIIAWAYIDAGLKLGFFTVSTDLNKWFTAE